MRTLFADVAYEDGVVRASFWDYTPAGPRAASSTRASGCAATSGTMFGSTEQLRGVSLFVGRAGEIGILEPRAGSRSRCPTRSIRSLYNYYARRRE